MPHVLYVLPWSLYNDVKIVDFWITHSDLIKVLMNLVTQNIE